MARAADCVVPDTFDVFLPRFLISMGFGNDTLKVLGIFARLYHRDGKSGYFLKDLPLVLKYTSVAARYCEFVPPLRLLDDVAQKAGKDDTTQVGYTF